MAHFEDFEILRYVAKDFGVPESTAIAGHLVACSKCRSALASVVGLDTELRRLAAQGAMNDSAFTLPQGDPFYRRPGVTQPSSNRTSIGSAAVIAAARATALAPKLLEAARNPEALASLFSTLDLAQGEHRFALFYALHEAGCSSAEDPFKAISFARQALGWVRASGTGEVAHSLAEAEQMVPRVALRAQAHLLLGIAELWTSRYSRAGSHLVVAYRGFASGGGDETKLAQVELAEAQRRSFCHEPSGSLVLVRRARETFADRAMEDYVARAWVVEGLALAALGRDEEAVRTYRDALPVFERLGLWSNYVGALNSIATSLSRLGRHDESRREYARALKHFSSEEHRYWQGYLRLGLAEALFGERRYREAAVSGGKAATTFGDCKLRAQSLIAMLLEIESWARTGDLARARQRLRLFWIEVQRDGSLDQAILEELDNALSGINPNFEKLPSLRARAETQIQDRCRAGLS